MDEWDLANIENNEVGIVSDYCSVTKTEVKKAFQMVPGYKVFTFNSNRYASRGSTGFVDHVLLNPKKGIVIFVEVKIGKDTLNKKQIETQDICKEIMKKNSNVKYYVVDEKNYLDVIQEIINLS